MKHAPFISKNTARRITKLARVCELRNHTIISQMVVLVTLQASLK